MPKTISQGFAKLRQNTNITGLQASTVSTRQKNIRSALEEHLTVVDSFLAGSYKRSTMIAPLAKADVDVFVALDAGYYEPQGQANLLDRVKRVLKKEYPKTPKISRNGQAVTITFADFVVDVVPAFEWSLGGYLIPDSILGRWIGTDPKEHVTIWENANKGHNSKFVPVVKLLKAWNRKHSERLRSFHLETLALAVFSNITISDDPSGVRFFFDRARPLIRSILSDPAGYGGDVGAYVDTSAKQAAIVDRLDAALERALDAEALASDGKVELAYKKWQWIFGDCFPAYG